MHETPIADPQAGTAHGLPDSGSVEEIAEGLRRLGPDLDVWLGEDSESEQGGALELLGRTIR